VNTVAAVLANQLLRSVDAFNVRRETSGQYNQQAPLLDDWSAALFAVGVVLVTLRARRTSYFVLASWFWLTLILGEAQRNVRGDVYFYSIRVDAQILFAPSPTRWWTTRPSQPPR